MLTTLVFVLGLGLAFWKPSWKMIAAFTALIFATYIGLVWVSMGSYLSAAQIELDGPWGALLIRALMWSGAFLLMATGAALFRRRRARA